MKRSAEPKRAARVLVVDDHPVVRQGLAQLIKQETDLEYVGGAEDAADALKAIEKLTPDVAVVDVSLRKSSGLELIKDIKVRFPKLPVIVLSMHDESFYAERALRAGARGYVMKEEATEKVLTALRKVLAGDLYLSDNMSARLLSKFVDGRAEAGQTPAERLSDRELEVFQFIGQGLGTRLIAKNLHLSIKTIEAHRANIKRKLKLRTASELLQHAIQWVQSEKQRAS